MGCNPQVSQTKKVSIRAASVLTLSFVNAATTISMQNWNQLILWLDFTTGSSTGFTVRLEAADDEQLEWYKLPAIDAAVIASNVASVPTYASEYTFAAVTDKYVLPIPANYRYIRVSAKALTSATDTSLAIYYTQGLV